MVDFVTPLFGCKFEFSHPRRKASKVRQQKWTLNRNIIPCLLLLAEAKCALRNTIFSQMVTILISTFFDGHSTSLPLVNQVNICRDIEEPFSTTFIPRRKKTEIKEITKFLRLSSLFHVSCRKFILLWPVVVFSYCHHLLLSEPLYLHSSLLKDGFINFSYSSN